MSVPSSELGPPLTPSTVSPHRLSLAGGGGGGGGGGSQFGRLEKKPSTLSTLCSTPFCGVVTSTYIHIKLLAVL